VMFMLAVIVVQLNVHTETGMRRFVIARAASLCHFMQPVCKACWFKVRQLFVAGDRKARA